MISKPLVKRTFATLRKAEFGFFGVVVYTFVHTPRRCGHDVKAALLLRYVFGSRPFLMSCWTVGMFYLSSFVSPILQSVTLRKNRDANVHLYLTSPRPVVNYFYLFAHFIFKTLIFNIINLSQPRFFFNISVQFLLFSALFGGHSFQKSPPHKFLLFKP